MNSDFPKSKILAIIPARGGSKSIPRKNIKQLSNYPLIVYTIAAAAQSKLIGKTIVSTDDDEIASIAIQWGAEVPFIRPFDLAMDDTYDLPVFQHALKWLEMNENYFPDIVVHLRPTSPLRPLGCIDYAINLLFRNFAADSVRTVSLSRQNPYKMWSIENGFLSPLLSFRVIDEFYSPRQQLPKTFFHTGHVDVIRKEIITNRDSMSGENIYPMLIDPSFVVDIDEEEDWKFAEWKISTNNLEFVKPEMLS